MSEFVVASRITEPLKWCAHCTLRVFGPTGNHPCCDLWARLTPNKPCQGCGASNGYWAAQKGRRNTPATIGYTGPEPWRCGACGLTDAGYERRSDVGLPVRPCPACEHHFEAVAA